MKRALYVLATSVLCACSPSTAEEPKDAGRADAAPARANDIETTEPSQPPCQRTTVIVLETNDGARTWSMPLPCRPYDRLRDDPRPPE